MQNCSCFRGKWKFFTHWQVTEPGEKSLNGVLCYIYLELRTLTFKWTDFYLLMRYCLVGLFENPVSDWLQKEELCS